MPIDFIAPNPFQPMGAVLANVLHGATRVDAAVAFVTRNGLQVVNDFLATHPNFDLRLVASVRFPTDLDALARLAGQLSGNVFIHTGYNTPREQGRQRGQFHSKIVLVEYPGNRRCIVIGSHNWTQNALEGFNLEAGLVLTCDRSDAIVGEVQSHIENCIQLSEAFDHVRLQLYRAIQKDLYEGPGNRESERVPGFVEHVALIIHAEYGGHHLDVMQLFIPLRSDDHRRFFIEEEKEREVLLFLYPVGTLENAARFDSAPILYTGHVKMDNAIDDAAVELRDASHSLDNFQHPHVLDLPGNVPTPSGEMRQIMIRLHRRGSSRLPIFHSGDQYPRMRVGVEYRAAADNVHRIWNLKTEGNKATGTLSDLVPLVDEPDFSVPANLTFDAELDVPNPELYEVSIEEQVRVASRRSQLLPVTAELQVTVQAAGRANMISPYVYLVQYQFDPDKAQGSSVQEKLF